MSNLFLAFANLLDLVITIYTWLVIIRVILSWLSVDSYNPFVQFIIRVTEPALSKIRGIVPNLGGLDISPMVLILGLYLAESILVGTFTDLALSMR